jgi:NAD(P)-dependent dehydrogenase (short-subunit alcohol dehydrogenase family)
MNIKVDPTEFAGKRVLVSGGTKGLGRATVERFLAGGARVITAARAIKDPIAGVDYVQADLTTPEGGEALAKAALERLDGIDILAHVIGGSAAPAGGFAALTDDHWLAELNLNLLATVRLDRLQIPQMIGRGAEPEEVADLIAYLSSGRAAAIHGAEFVIDGGTIRTVEGWRPGVRERARAGRSLALAEG